MPVQWSRNIDSTLAQARLIDKPILIDFTAAPPCAWLEAELYADESLARFINENFLPVEFHIKEHALWFDRFDVTWTPTVLILNSQGREIHPIEGYLPKDEFQAQLEMGLARIAFKGKKWREAERVYSQVAEKYPNTSSAPEACYWRAVSHYKDTNDHSVLSMVAQELQREAPQSVWAKKALPWLGH